MSRALLLFINEKGDHTRSVINTLHAMDINTMENGQLSVSFYWSSDINPLPDETISGVINDLIYIVMEGDDFTAVVYPDNKIHHVFRGIMDYTAASNLARFMWMNDPPVSNEKDDKND